MWIVRGQTWYSEAEYNKLKDFIKQISEKLDYALDAEKSDAEESLKMLYELSDEIENVLNAAD